MLAVLACAGATPGCRKAAPTPPAVSKPATTPDIRPTGTATASAPSTQQASPAAIEQARQMIATGLLQPALRKASEVYSAATRAVGPETDEYIRTLRQADHALAGGDYRTAEVLFRKACQAQPDRLEAYEGLAMTLSAAEQFDPAAAAYQKIIDLTADLERRAKPPASTESTDRLRRARTIARHNLAVARCHLGELAQAERIYRQLIEDDPDAIQFRFNLATVLQARGLSSQAVETWQEVVAQADQLPQADAAYAWAALGLLQLDLGRPQQAFDAYVKLTQLTPEDPRAWLSYSLAARGCGSLGRAIAGAQRAIALSPKDDTLLEHLGDLYVDLYGQTSQRQHLELAISAWRRSLAINPRQPALDRRVEQYRKVLENTATSAPATATSATS
jgi:tetratricopeptide (TPR) repeat protein